MAIDPLDNEISISGELTEHGVKASAKSRTLAAIDRLCGNLVDAANIPVERFNSRSRAEMAAEQAAIEAAAKMLVQRIEGDSQFAERAIQQHLESILLKQTNKDAVAHEAIEQLKLAPPTTDQSNSGPAELDDGFLNRLESYAEGATTEQLREKWGRVLASEVRKPGTFNGKAMRVVDEMDPETAKLFERVCRFRFGNVLPKALAKEELRFPEVTALTTADLMIDPGFVGQIKKFGSGKHGDVSMRFLAVGKFAIAVSLDARPNKDDVLKTEDDNPVLPVFVLTDVGEAIASILDDTEEAAFDKLVSQIHSNLPDIELRLFRKVGQAGQLEFIRTIPAEGVKPS